ncbi:hypothetical protein GCM10009789_83680 [Kribbella sancticallisti]|uniref:Methyltransferase type 11 domain-containing protein n=1 Tax=Kribbella sancticallisti TaxID=460087 RepID=A0ABN2ETL8_9ACTN
MSSGTRAAGQPTKPEQWAEWVLRRRFGGDPDARRQTDQFIEPIRRRLLDLAELRPEDVVLDIASRDGYMGVGAAERLSADGRVIFTELSEDLLTACQTNAEAAMVPAQCEYRQLPPDDLSTFADASVDVVIVRSILNYVEDRIEALSEYRRVLRPGGRLAMIQMFPNETKPGWLSGYYVPEVADLAARVGAVLDSYSPKTETLYEERVLIAELESVGFETLYMWLNLEISRSSDWPPPRWELAKQMSTGPDQPTLDEAITEALDPAEADRLIAVLRVEVESGRRAVRFPKAFIRAIRD